MFISGLLGLCLGDPKKTTSFYPSITKQAKRNSRLCIRYKLSDASYQEQLLFYLVLQICATESLPSKMETKVSTFLLGGKNERVYLSSALHLVGT